MEGGLPTTLPVKAHGAASKPSGNRVEAVRPVAHRRDGEVLAEHLAALRHYSGGGADVGIRIRRRCLSDEVD